MNPIAARRIELFSLWLKTLPADVRSMSSLLGPKELEGTRTYVAAGITYLTRNLDLIPDGIEGIGYLDDAFVLRTAAALAVEAVGVGAPAALRRLAQDNVEVESFMGPDYGRFRTYVGALREHVTKGRTVAQVAGDATLAKSLAQEAIDWCADYKESALTKDEAQLDRLRTFLHSKLSLVRG